MKRAPLSVAERMEEIPVSRGFKTRVVEDVTLDVPSFRNRRPGGWCRSRSIRSRRSLFAVSAQGTIHRIAPR